MFWPTVNSYKRLVDGFWAPVKPTWGIDNRTASFRVILGGAKSTRLETRCPGADINPYLAVAALLAAGLHGIEKGMKLTAPPITGTNLGAENIARAPRSLAETTEIFKRSAVARTGSATTSSITSPRRANGSGASGRTRSPIGN